MRRQQGCLPLRPFVGQIVQGPIQFPWDRRLIAVWVVGAIGDGEGLTFGFGCERKMAPAGDIAAHEVAQHRGGWLVFRPGGGLKVSLQGWVDPEVETLFLGMLLSRGIGGS